MTGATPPTGAPGLSRGAARILVTVFPLLAGLLSFVLLRNGIHATPDSWTFWEGSVSLLETGTYSRFGGERILEWPPLFSVYLAGLQAVLGSTGAALCAAMSLLAACNVLAWGAYVRRIFDGWQDRLTRVAFFGAMLFLLFFSVLCSLVLLAHMLLLVCTGLAYAWMIRAVRATDRRAFLLDVAKLATTLVAALLAHNTALVHVAAAAVVLAFAPRQRFHVRLWAAGLVALLPTLLWYLARYVLGQSGSHAAGDPFFSAPTYLWQTVIGLGDFFSIGQERFLWLRAAAGAAFILGATGLAVFRRKPGVDTASNAVLYATAISYLLLFLLFNTLWIDSTLSGRFIWFVPLAVVPLLAAAVRSRPAILAAVLLFVLTLPAARTVRGLIEGAAPRTIPGAASTARHDHIAPWYYLANTKPERRPVDARLIVPPTYPWMPRWQQMPYPASERERVHILAP